jgi:hypothetical protein
MLPVPPALLALLVPLLVVAVILLPLVFLAPLLAVVVAVVVARVRGVVVRVGVEVGEVEVKGSVLAVLRAGVVGAVEEMGWAGHLRFLQEGAACTAQQQQQPGCERPCLVG